MEQRTSPTAPGKLRKDDPERDILVVKFELEREDIMKFKPLYEATYTWLQDEGFAHPNTKDDKIEEMYWERWTPSGAKEQHIWWRADKNPNQYVRYFLMINWQTLNVTKAEVAYKNKKVNAEKIDLIIRVEFWLQWDYKDLFKNSLAWQFRKIFFNKLYAQELEDHKNQLRETATKLHRLMRTYFEMTMEGDYPVQLFPPMGYKDQ
jgi:hypothetical protein